MKYLLMATSGFKGSGKDEVAHMLQYLLSTPKIMHNYWCYQHIRVPKKWKIKSFANPLKKTLGTILGIDYKKFNSRDFKENYFVQLDSFRIVEKYLLDEEDILSDNKFTKYLKSGNPFPSDTWLSIRQLMQYFGTNVMQTYLGRKVWINSTLINWEKSIISDVRFKTEFEEIKNLNGIVIYVKRPGIEAGSHASEREVADLLEQNKYDFIIDNNGSLEDLFNKTKYIVWVVEKLYKG